MTVDHSGTVGAVVTADEFDVPAIALSTEVPIDDISQVRNVPFARTADVAADGGTCELGCGGPSEESRVAAID